MSQSASTTHVHDAESHPDFKARVADALLNDGLGRAMDTATRRQDTGRRNSMPELGEGLGLHVRELAARIKNHTLQNLDRYLEQLVGKIEALGGHVHFAQDGEQARQIICAIARQAGVRTIAKAKSMASEEIELNHALEADGFEVTETDLGEYILQLAGEKPSHIVTPVLHKTRGDIGRLFAEKLGIAYTDDPPTLTAVARKILREKFRTADMGITGANFAVADTGTVCIVTNEGNGRMCTSVPRVLVSLMGLEKLVPRMSDLAVMLKVLAKSATGQRITCYTNLITGPRRPGDHDGPEEFHLVILDRGRSDVLGSEFWPALRCIRCGACLNACPVYRKVGGHAYESVYPGPIGKVITPLLDGLAKYHDLPQASSLCEACFEACPQRIELPEMLIKLRGRLVDEGHAPLVWRFGFKGWRLGMSSHFLYRVGARMFRWTMRLFARRGFYTWLPGQGSVWTRYRDFPALNPKPFHKRWQDLQRSLKHKGER